MPGLHHPVSRALGRDGQPVELARQTDGEVADVDHLLDFAPAFFEDLAAFHGDERAEVILVGAKLLTQKAHQLSPPRRWHAAPHGERRLSTVDLGRDHLRGIGFEPRDLGSVDRRGYGEVAATALCRVEPERCQQVFHVHRMHPHRSGSSDRFALSKA